MGKFIKTFTKQDQFEHLCNEILEEIKKEELEEKNKLKEDKK